MRAKTFNRAEDVITFCDALECMGIENFTIHAKRDKLIVYFP